MIVICDKMGWSYFEYKEQPKSFINKIWTHMMTKDKAKDYLQSQNNGDSDQ